MTEQELRNNKNWHFIELSKMSIDVDRLVDWYTYVSTNLSHLKFNFGRTDLILGVEEQTDDSSVLKGGIHSYGLSWPVEQDLPLPPRFAARPDLYPETVGSEEDFNSRVRVMDRYKFGYFKDLYNLYGEDFFAWARITVHDAGAEIKPHTDGEKNVFRIHIPILTNKDALFCWGDSIYNFEVGKAYLINTSIPHCTINNGTTERSHIITHPRNVSWILENLV